MFERKYGSKKEKRYPRTVMKGYISRTLTQPLKTPSMKTRTHENEQSLEKRMSHLQAALPLVALLHIVPSEGCKGRSR